MSAAPKFTIAQIAAALAKSPRAIRKALDGIGADGTLIVAGNPAAAWSLESMPTKLREQLQTVADRKFYRDAADLLQNPDRRWPDAGQIPPLREIAPEAVAKAEQLRQALAGAIVRRNDRQTSASEKERLGLDEYKSAFGHAISGRHWRDLVTRAVRRDRGFEEFHRLELYVDQNAPRKRDAADVQAACQCANIERVFGNLSDAAAPGEAEVRSLWIAAFEDFAALQSERGSERTAKELVLGDLWQRAPFIAKTRDALRKAFDRKRARWIKEQGNPKALKDRRIEVNESRRIVVPTEDLDLLTAHAVIACGGRTAQAFRELMYARKFSAGFMDRFGADYTRKSYVPTVVREAVRHEVAMMNGVHSAPRNERDQGAYLSRNWDMVPAGAWWNADDATLPVYFILPDLENKWWTLMRGQFLLMIDLRSTMILGYALMPSTGYNARTIRGLVTRCADEYGLPTQGFYFEKGIWKNSRILTGSQSEAAMPWESVELGLREFGLKFQYAIRARSKPVERVLGALQNYMERDPGYAGRDERHDPQEHFQKTKLAIEARRIDPVGKFYTLKQWDQRLGEVCELYNAEIREGKQTRNLSPRDAYEAHFDENNPPVRFDATCRHLLAHHKRVCKVTVNGITLRFGKQPFVYRNARTGALRGQNVIAWFDPDAPELITVTDMKRRDAFTVERTNDVPAIGATAEELGVEMAKLESHMGYARDRYRVLKSGYQPATRPNLVDRQTVEMANLITGAREEVASQKRQSAGRDYRLRQAAGEAGVSVAIIDRERPDVGSGLRQFSQARERIRQRQQQEEPKE